MAKKDPLLTDIEIDRPKEFSLSDALTTEQYVQFWCANNKLKHDAETEKLKMAMQRKRKAARTAGPKRKLP